MGRGKRQGTASAQLAQVPLTAGGRSAQVLPETLVASLKPAHQPKPRAQRPKAPEPVSADGTLSELGRTVLAALAAQSDRQKAAKDWNGSRVPNGMLEYPDGISESKYKKTLTFLRRAGYVHTKNGMWWVLPEGREQLGQDPSL